MAEHAHKRASNALVKVWLPFPYIRMLHTASNMVAKEHRREVRVTVLGDEKVGKTSLVLRAGS